MGLRNRLTDYSDQVLLGGKGEMTEQAPYNLTCLPAWLWPAIMVWVI
jgi:hypothetical protein